LPLLRQLSRRQLQRPHAFVNHAARAWKKWGGPDPAHSSSGVIFPDENGDKFIGAEGTCTVTTTDPPVDGFRSVTVYDTDRGGFLLPNDGDRYHLNNTVSARHADGTVTFTFKKERDESDLNCRQASPGQFDIVIRHYRPHEEITSGEWTWPRISLYPAVGTS